MLSGLAMPKRKSCSPSGMPRGSASRKCGEPGRWSQTRTTRARFGRSSSRSRLAVAMSPCSSHKSWVERKMGDQGFVVLQKARPACRAVRHRGIVVRDALEPRDMADRTQRRATHFTGRARQCRRSSRGAGSRARPLEMVVPKMRPAHVPVKIFGLQVKRARHRRGAQLSAAPHARGAGGEVVAWPEGAS